MLKVDKLLIFNRSEEHKRIEQAEQIFRIKELLVVSVRMNIRKIKIIQSYTPTNNKLNPPKNTTQNKHLEAILFKKSSTRIN
jgi:hypothetical protein